MGKIRGGENVTMKKGYSNGRGRMGALSSMAGKFLMRKVPTTKLPMANSQFMKKVRNYSNRFMGKMTSSEKVPGVMREVLNRCLKFGVERTVIDKADVAKNIYFPSRYYDKIGTPLIDKDGHTPIFPSNTTEYTRGIKVSEFNKCLMREYKDSLLLLCQPIGGFEVDFDLLAKDKNGTPEKIFERLKQISDHNLVAFSEGGELEYSEGTEMFDPMIKVGEFKCGQNPFAVDDTGFVGDSNSIELNFSKGTLNNLSLHKGDQSVFSNSKYLKSQGLNILNVHLPSKGPGELYKPNVVKAVVESLAPATINSKDIHYESINQFLKTYLPSNEELQVIPDIIVGDTNITSSKCVTKNIKSDPTNRMDIIRHITRALNELYTQADYSWGVLMNPITIEKKRSYGFLLDQQINKSNLIEAPEEDGTIIAFKYLIQNKDILKKEFFIEHSGQYWEVCLGAIDTDYISVTPNDSVKFLTFDSVPLQCLDEKFKLKDRLFIDHAPVQFSFEGMISLKKTLGGASSEPASPVPASPVPASPKNLIALNLGSIINSKKMWNLDLIKIIKDIQVIDESLFDQVRNAICKDPLNKLTLEKGMELFKYDSFQGKDFGNLLLTDNTIDDVAQAMNIAELEIKNLFVKNKISYHVKPIVGGFRSIKSKKNRKTKNKNKSKKIKNNTKRKRKQYKY